MIYATVEYENEKQLCCIDIVGERVFLLSEFFKTEIGEKKAPKTMLDFLNEYEPEWTDDIAFFFGGQPKTAVPLNEVKILAPIPVPSRNIVCLGKNYEAHAQEIKNQILFDKASVCPIYFTKPDHAVIGTEDNILLHESITQKLDYEVELAVIIGKRGMDIPKEEAEDYIFGYTIANDITARDLQQDHTQWYKGKSLISHCPMGPWIVHKSLLPFPLSLEMKSYINGELRQHGNTKDMIFDIPTIISDLSRGYELRPGDIILTGTPAGVGMGFDPPKYLKTGDQVICQIEKIGVLRNIVR
ncbi:MAG: fumarylacetoacetate hydrolase family protein [Anaerovoracaceae bacterium]|jgi:2-keto-4-pentenoate hydratase/2-oxohepta-3-ene-1,7-dioic acid hydratase in catechol pathway